MNKLQEIRVKRNLTQKELSELSKISIRTLQSLEQNVNNIDRCKLDILVSIVKVLKCKIRDILNDEDLIKKCKDVEL